MTIEDSRQGAAQPGARPRQNLQIILKSFLPLALVVGLVGCGEDFREPNTVKSTKSGTSTSNERTRRPSTFARACQSLKRKSSHRLLLQRLAKIADQRHVVCRKMAQKLEAQPSLDLSATIDDEQVDSASLVFYLKHLQTLTLTDNRLKDVKGVKRLASLTSLDVSGNIRLGEHASNWQEVARLPLRQLNIAMTRTANLAPFKSLNFLESLDITGNEGITDLSPIAPLASLTQLEYTGIALGTTTPATQTNCPTDAKSPAVAQLCRGLIEPADSAEGKSPAN